jgi:hypothetical protein
MIFRIFFIFLILFFQESTFAAFPSTPSSREGNLLNRWQRDSVQPFILLQEKITNPEEAMSNSLKVVTVITEYKDSVSLVNIATAFSVLGRISSENPTIRKDLKESKEFTNLISVLEERIDKFKTREFVNALVGLVKIGYYNEDLFDRLAENCIDVFIEDSKNLDPQNLANTAWAFASIDHYSESLFDALKEESIRQISGFNHQNLANTAWAFASIDHYSESLFDALKEESIRQISGFNHQNLANTAWAFAKVDHYSERLFNALQKESIRKIRDLNPLNLANTTWAFAEVGHYSESLFDALEKESIRKIRGFNPQSLANTAWAFASIDHYSESLFDALKEESIRQISGFTPQNLANTAWAFAKVDHYSESLFDALEEESIKKVRNFNPQNLANTAWAFASIGHRSKSIFRALKEESISQLDDFSSQDLANTAWAFAIFNKKDTVKKIIDHVIKNYDVSRLPLKTKTQLIQAASLFKNEYSKLIEQVGSLDIETHPSALQKQIFDLLVQIGKGISFTEEEEVTKGCIVDIAINANKIAIEIDGPSHYTRNSSEKRHLLGRNRLKENILEAQGWKLIRIPYFVWDSKTTESDRKEYLSSLLKKNGFTFPEKRKRSDSK